MSDPKQTARWARSLLVRAEKAERGLAKEKKKVRILRRAGIACRDWLKVTEGCQFVLTRKANKPCQCEYCLIRDALEASR